MIKKVLKTVVAYFSCFLFILFINPIVNASQEQIDFMSTTVTIQKNGVIHVDERIVYNFGGLQKHGIFRDIPYTKTNQDGKKFNLEIKNITVVDQKGSPYTFIQSTGNGNIDIKIGDADKLVSGVKAYMISYDVYGAITYFSEHDELYWNLTGNEWPVPIIKSTNTIIYPSDIPTDNVNAICYTGIKGSISKDCNVSKNGSQISVETINPLNIGEGITGVVSFPKGFIQVLEPKEDKSWIAAAIIFFIWGIGSLFWYVFVPLRLLIIRSGNKKFLQKNQKIVAAWFDPPLNDDRTRYTPAETGFIIDRKPDNKEITATIIHLAQKGYIKIIQDEKNKNEFSFSKIKEYEDDASLQEFEKTILKGLFNGKIATSTKELSKSTEFASKIAKYTKQVETLLETKSLFEGKIASARARKLAYEVGSVMTFNLFLGYVVLAFRAWYIKFTLKGVEKYSETASLLNFLKSQDEQLDFQAKNQMFFEKLLPYATAFGVEDVWAKRFGDLEFKPSDWYQGDMSNVFMASAISHSINNSIGSSVAYSSSRSSSGFSSGFSGGGSSGGGGGGGGGGSW